MCERLASCIIEVALSLCCHVNNTHQTPRGHKIRYRRIEYIVPHCPLRPETGCCTSKISSPLLLKTFVASAQKCRALESGLLTESSPRSTLAVRAELLCSSFIRRCRITQKDKTIRFARFFNKAYETLKLQKKIYFFKFCTHLNQNTA